MSLSGKIKLFMFEIMGIYSVVLNVFATGHREQSSEQKNKDFVNLAYTYMYYWSILKLLQQA